MSRGRATPVVRTTDGLVAVEGINPTTYHGAHVDAGAAAEVQIRDGSATGTILWTLRLTAAGNGDDQFRERGIGCAGGIWVEVVSGTPTVTVYCS